MATRSVSWSSFRRKGTSSRKDPKKVAAKVATYLILGILAFLFVFPYIWLVLASFKTPEAIFRPGFQLFPVDENGNLQFVFVNYTNALESLNLGRVFMNTMVVCVVNTALNLILNAMAGYAFARIDFAGRKWLFPFVLAAMMIPGAIMTIPNLVICQALGTIDTIWALILPFVMSIYNVFLMRQQFMGLSKELEEAAVMDGAGSLRVFFTICLPLVSPMLVVLGITTFMWNYNNFMWTLLALPTNNEVWTLARSLGELVSAGRSDPNRYPQMLAGSVITSLPLIVIFFVLQKYILQGISLGGVKE